MGKGRNGFTMVELLVVIAIIGVVAGASVGVIKGYARQARAVKCQSNMHALAKAVMAYRADTGYYPAASAYETYDKEENNYFAHRGWVNWVRNDNNRSRRNDPANPYKGHNGWQEEGSSAGLTSSKAGEYRYVGTGRESRDLVGATGSAAAGYKNIQNSRIYRSIDEGSLFVYADKIFSIYCCDEYKGLQWDASKKKLTYSGANSAGKYVMRSYAMNHVFGSRTKNWSRVPLSSIPNNAERLVLFIEFDEKNFTTGNRAGSNDRNGESGSTADATRKNYSYWADDGSWEWEKGENLGFPHMRSGNWYGHVVFADGHLESVEPPWTNKKQRTLDSNKCKKQRDGLGQGLGYTY